MAKIRVTIVLLVFATICHSFPRRTQLGGGTEFYIAFPRQGYVSEQAGVVINSRAPQNITVTAPSGSISHFKFSPLATHQFISGFFPVLQQPDQVLSKAATHIVTERLASIQGQMGVNAIGGTFTALPVAAWGSEYLVLGSVEGDNQYAPGNYSVPGITIIAAHDGTSVVITPSTKTAGGHLAGDSYVVTLNAGDLYYITTPADPHGVPPHDHAECEADLSGTRISSSNPVGVLVSNSAGSVVCGDIFCSDYAIEWLPPIANWDTAYAWVPTGIRNPAESSDLIRFMFAESGTQLSFDDGGGAHVLGNYGPGDPIEFVPRSSNAILFSANKPFLLANFTKKDTGCNASVHAGNPWNFSMTYYMGVHQWPSRVLFSDANKSTGSFVSVFFSANAKPHVRLNGSPLSMISPTSQPVGSGYSTFHADYGTINADINNAVVLDCDSGYTAWGAVWGHGSSSIWGGNGLTSSYSHVISIADIPLISSDSIAPHCSVNNFCGSWTITAYDDADSSTGLGESYLEDSPGTDSSYNCSLTKKYSWGDINGTVTISVTNLTQAARAVLHVRDLAGNSFDTTLIYAPLNISVSSPTIVVGPVASGDSVDASLTLTNKGANPIVFSQGRLLYGSAHRWSIVQGPSFPVTLASNDSLRFVFRYRAATGGGVDDDDSLLLTTCREFQVAYLHVILKRAVASVQSASVACATIDSLGIPGDTLQTSDVAVASVGTDTLVVTNGTLVGISPADLVGDVSTDVTSDTPLPSPSSPWHIGPGDTQRVTLHIHPHHSGLRTAAVVFTSESATSPDTALINFCGLARTSAVIDNHQAGPGIFSLDAYPNPITSAKSQSATITFSLARREHVTITLTTLLGACVATLFDGVESAGLHSVSMVGSTLPEGVYVYSVRMGSEIMSRAIVAE